ncbi:RAD52 motif-containing protein 1-like [Nycticebus coucang]|uniref:RAD52 motif-containing protein 1-like n=1 Tax=Nycticebus coucang TaxID=9470 RepID=UPI00234D1AEE|nr:RAD52 motif-containing protein 1-like [Nycticebus coucang]
MSAGALELAAEEPVHNLEEGPLSFLMKRKIAQRLAIQKALSDALQKLLIVVLGNLMNRKCLNRIAVCFVALKGQRLKNQRWP